ncbi:MAG: hypothetical protein ACKKMV_00335 [Candidatus Nealsonbacteria bacterium]
MTIGIKSFKVIAWIVFIMSSFGMLMTWIDELRIPSEMRKLWFGSAIILFLIYKFLSKE